MKKIYVVVAALFCILLAAATANDLAISLALFNPDNAVARLFERFGQVPGNALLIVCAVGICGAAPSLRMRSPLRAALCTGLAILLLAAGFYVVFSLLVHESGLATLPALLCAAALVILCYMAFLPVCRTSPRKVIFVCVCGLLTFVVSMGAIGVLKVLWGRQRFFSMDDPLSQFTPWYLPQLRGRGDQFRSFPSGHACAAALLVWWTLLPEYFNRLRAWRLPVWAAYACYLGAMMTTRIILGRHFLSDVTVGAGLTIAVFFCVRFAARKTAHSLLN